MSSSKHTLRLTPLEYDSASADLKKLYDRREYDRNRKRKPTAKISNKPALPTIELEEKITSRNEDGTLDISLNDYELAELRKAITTSLRSKIYIREWYKRDNPDAKSTRIDDPINLNEKLVTSN